MGHIKEPKGVDFVIASDPLTDKARQEISEFIRNYKSNSADEKLNQQLQKNKQKLYTPDFRWLSFKPLLTESPVGLL